MRRLSESAPARSVTEVGPGDYVKVGSRWERIQVNDVEGAQHPHSWTILTENGYRGMYDIDRYAKADDFDG